MIEDSQMADLHSVNNFVKKHQSFTVGGLRNWIANDYRNGLKESGAILRVGRKVLINDEKFFAWIESLNEAA